MQHQAQAEAEAQAEVEPLHSVCSVRLQICDCYTMWPKAFAVWVCVCERVNVCYQAKLSNYDQKLIRAFGQIAKFNSKHNRETKHEINFNSQPPL